MRKPVQFIIGFSLGTRSVGVAILRKEKLIHWRVHAFRQPWSQKKCQAILRKLHKLIERYQPHAIGIKIPSEPYCSKQLNRLKTTLTTALDSHNSPYTFYSVTDLKVHCFGTEKCNKKKLVACIGAKYPELTSKSIKETTNKHSHHTKLFEATIVAEIIQKKLNE